MEDIDELKLREKMNAPKIDMSRVLDVENNIEKYHGGLACIDFGQIVMPLPFPDDGKKWGERLRDTPSGEILPDIVQVPIEEELTDWYEGYPKYGN